MQNLIEVIKNVSDDVLIQSIAAICTGFCILFFLGHFVAFFAQEGLEIEE